MSRVRIIARGIRRSHDERAVPPNRAAGERRATQSGHGSSCHTLLTPTEPQRLPRFVRLSHVRVYAYAHARTYVRMCGGAITSLAAGCPAGQNVANRA